jgi:transcriptional regulator with XRE-family HTH domain
MQCHQADNWLRRIINMPPTPNTIKAASLVRQARETKGLTIREAAQQLGVDHTHYVRMETGERLLGKHLPAVAKLLGLDAEELAAIATDRLPGLAPYLRAKYDLTDEAVAELEAHFKAVSKQTRPKKRSWS